MSQNVTLTANSSQNKSKKSFKKLPYVAAGVVLAGLAIYVSRNKLNPMKNKALKEETAEAVTIIENNVQEKAHKMFENFRTNLKRSVLPQYANERIDTMKIILPANTINAAQDANGLKKEIAATETKIKEAKTIHKQLFLPLPQKPKEKLIFTGFENGKPTFQKLKSNIEQPTEPIISAFREARKDINFVNDKVIDKILKIKTENASEINRIISENTKDGHVDLKMMRKIAHDFAADEAGRGADRFHQAAELLEQSYIKEFIKKDGSDVKGIFNLHDFMKTDSELFSLYIQMPAEEVANRLNYIRYNDLLRGGVEKDMKPEMFVEKMFDRLVEKKQFQRYIDAHKGEIKAGI